MNFGCKKGIFCLFCSRFRFRVKVSGATLHAGAPQKSLSFGAFRAERAAEPVNRTGFGLKNGIAITAAFA
jgi:hypothetical protein